MTEAPRPNGIKTAIEKVVFSKETLARLRDLLGGA